MVIPASIARLLSDRFSHMIFISAMLGAFFSLFGTYLSYYFNIASGASVVLLSTKRCQLVAFSTRFK
ncbi:MAG: metal ABC transporter permease [Cyanobacteria bacterium P01_F01_bin.53]